MAKDTRERILQAALDLFSVKGYDAVGVEEIAEAVGIKAPSLYNHFKGKKEIFDSLIEDISQEYRQGSMFEQDLFGKLLSRETKPSLKEMEEILIKSIMEHMHMLVRVDRIKKVRTFLTIEQFRNERLGKMLTDKTYDSVLAFYTEQIHKLIEAGILQDMGADIMGLQFMAPISVLLSLVDRDPSRSEEAVELLKKHVHRFFAVYTK